MAFGWISALFFVESILLLTTRCTNAYPVLLQVDEEGERCFQFQIPVGDEAHLVAAVIPSEDDLTDPKVEAWYFEQVYKLTKNKSDRKVIPKKFDDMPNHVSSAMSEYYKKAGNANASPLVVMLTNRPTEEKYENQYTAKLFQPLVVNFIARSTNARNKRKNTGRPEDESLDGYGMCIQNRDTENQFQIVMDIVLVSDEIPDDLDQAEGFSKDAHLTPLERSLQDSIDSAENILREMRYMEQRERRMRLTTDSINGRVRWFSYLSVSILLAVTYIQVSYLKRYFHKKKLM